MTNQQIADLALELDRERRAHIRRGELEQAAGKDRELSELLEKLQ